MGAFGFFAGRKPATVPGVGITYAKQVGLSHQIARLPHPEGWRTGLGSGLAMTSYFIYDFCGEEQLPLCFTTPATKTGFATIFVAYPTKKKRGVTSLSAPVFLLTH